MRMIIRHGFRWFTLLCLFVATPSLSMAAESITDAFRGPHPLMKYQSQPASERESPAATTERPVVLREGHTTNRPPIRSTDRRLRLLLEHGLRISPTLRALVARLHASDVVVYLQCDGPGAPDGRLTFLTKAAGYRYVVVRMARFPQSQQIAMMAHELQHAVEIADTPGIVDGPTLVREYRRIGYQNVSTPLPGISFDTRAAVRAGEQVLKELMLEEASY